MSNNNPEQLRLVGSLAGYDQGEHVQYPAPHRESAEAPERTLEVEAALGTLLMHQFAEVESSGGATQDPLPDLFDEVKPLEKPEEPTPPANFILGEE